MITTEDRNWLLNEFPLVMQKGTGKETLDSYERAEKLIGATTTKPSCGCQYNSYRQKIERLYKQWQDDLIDGI
jgi:hypothetical protein